MNERLPVKPLFELKMTHWYLSRKPIIQEAINKYPPGYYVYTNGETYRLIGWSEPEEKRGESEVFVYLERDIVAGTERLRIHPDYMSPEEELIEINQQMLQEVSHPVMPTIIGYNVGKRIGQEIKFLVDSGERRVFGSIMGAQDFLLAHGISTEEQLEDFVYEPIF